MTEQPSSISADLLMKIGEHGGRIGALEAGQAQVVGRLAHVEQQLGRIEAGQTAASEAHADRHLDMMGHIKELREALAPLSDLPGVIARLDRLDAKDEAQGGRSIVLPELTFRNVLAAFVLLAGASAVIAAALRGQLLGLLGG